MRVMHRVSVEMRMTIAMHSGVKWGYNMGSIICRGTWDHLLQEPSEEERPRIDGYQCNVCGKKFRCAT